MPSGFQVVKITKNVYHESFAMRGTVLHKRRPLKCRNSTALDWHLSFIYLSLFIFSLIGVTLWVHFWANVVIIIITIEGAPWKTPVGQHWNRFKPVQSPAHQKAFHCAALVSLIYLRIVGDQSVSEASALNHWKSCQCSVSALGQLQINYHLDKNRQPPKKITDNIRRFCDICRWLIN